MIVHETSIIIPAPVQRVFDFVTTNNNFPKWKKDVWAAGKTMGAGEGSKMVQTIQLMFIRKVTLAVTAYTPNRYFSFRVIKAPVWQPAYSFCFIPADNDSTQLSVTVEIAGLDHVKNSWMIYPAGVNRHWEVYLDLLCKEIAREEKEMLKSTKPVP